MPKPSVNSLTDLTERPKIPRKSTQAEMLRGSRFQSSDNFELNSTIAGLNEKKEHLFRFLEKRNTDQEALGFIKYTLNFHTQIICELLDERNKNFPTNSPRKRDVD